MGEINEYRKAVQDATAKLMNDPHMDVEAQENLSQGIMSAWIADSKHANTAVVSSIKTLPNGRLSTFSDKSTERITVDAHSGTMTVKDTLNNSDQAVTKYDLQTGDRIATTYIAPRVERGYIVTDMVNMVWDAGAKTPRITSVEETTASGTKKVIVTTDSGEVPKR